MKIILAMAISANGIIATDSGSEEFLSDDNWLQFVKITNKIGCFIWGRKTYEAVIQWPKSYFEELKDVKKIIVSKTNIQLKDGFILVHSPEEAIQKLEADGFKEIIITGGATLNSEFAKRKLIDGVILYVNPVILGSGIPLFSKANFDFKLKLVNMEKIGTEIVELKYEVLKN